MKSINGHRIKYNVLVNLNYELLANTVKRDILEKYNDPRYAEDLGALTKVTSCINLPYGWFDYEAIVGEDEAGNIITMRVIYTEMDEHFRDTYPFGVKREELNKYMPC